MEPYRPLIDRAVAALMDDYDSVPEFSREVREYILKSLTGNLKIGGESRSLFDALSRTSASLVQCLAGEREQLELPEGFDELPK